jgi:hypothetical protein
MSEIIREHVFAVESRSRCAIPRRWERATARAVSVGPAAPGRWSSLWTRRTSTSPEAKIS